MPDTITCPGCGAENPAGSESCTQCNFPLGQTTPPVAGREARATPVPRPAADARPFDPGPRPVRPRRPRPNAMEPVQMQLWLVTGVAVVLGIIYFAAQGFWKSNAPPVEGARPEQQQQADLARRTLEKDSTNVAARIALANILYDTGNWGEAILHYKTAARLDPRRPTTLVDMGVCYYNLSQFAAAESLFQHALELDPMQPVALFNLGVVAETQQRYEQALDFYHRAMQANPPEDMRKPLVDHMQTVMSKTGKSAPPIGQAK
ncbi:MAG TPA: tetratricopeptide repeat protein [Candidatus Eisenbacteria bacterium]|jgi:cytochrome c-type biogenesis protein CcmH/NrfG